MIVMLHAVVCVSVNVQQHAVAPVWEDVKKHVKAHARATAKMLVQTIAKIHVGANVPEVAVALAQLDVRVTVTQDVTDVQTIVKDTARQLVLRDVAELVKVIALVAVKVDVVAAVCIHVR